MNAIDSLIRQAIAGRHPIEFAYDNKKRVANPYIYGKSKLKNLTISAYQTGGESSKKLPGWRPFLLDKMLNLKVLNDRTFVPTDPSYNPDDKFFLEVIAKVKQLP